jgi:capsular exopolysaccharide synthesis family protein
MNESDEQNEKTLHFLDYWRVIRSRKELVLAVAFLVVLTGTIYTLMLPNIYASSARISVSEDMPEINPFAVQQSYMTPYNPFFLKTQFEVLTSKPILNEVIYRLDLQVEWGNEVEKLPRETALKILKNSLSVFQQRDTSLIVINVKRDNPQEAADIANEIAQVYRDSRLEMATKNAQLAIDQIEESLADQRLRVGLAEERIQNIREELNIAVVGGEGQFDVGEVRMQQLEGDRLFAQRAMLEKEGLLSILNGLDDKDLLERASYITFDQFVMNTIQQIQDIEVQLSSLSANYGVNHPEVKRLQLQVNTLEDKLDKRLRALRNGLETEYIIAKNNFESLDSVLTAVRSDTIESQGSKFRPYRNALADLETERFIYNQLKSKHRQEIITLQVPKNPVELIDVAEPELRPVSPNLFLNVLLSIFIGLGAGVGLAYFIEYLDTSVKNSEDLERVLGIPVVGQVPQKVRPLIEEGPDSDNAEPYRVLKTNLEFSNQQKSGVAYSVLSSGAGEGKSTTVFNLAYVSAQQGLRVLLIDADLRRPVQHTILGISNRFGLTNVLLRDVPVEETIKATSVPNLHFLPSGKLPRASLGVLDPKKIGELIQSLKSKYDLVLIDTAPIIGISDSLIIAKETDASFLVVQYRKYPREMVRKAKDILQSQSVNLAGSVLNNISIMRDDYYYYYHAYYSDYYKATDMEEGEADAI